MKKVGKATRPFSYDLNKIHYDYTVEVTNRFKGFSLLDKVPEELWIEVPNIVQEAVTKHIPKKKKFKKAKWLSEEALKITEKKRSKGEGKERYTQVNAKLQGIARRDKKAFSFLKKLIYFLLKDNCFTEFCCFLSNFNMNQP